MGLSIVGAGTFSRDSSLPGTDGATGTKARLWSQGWIQPVGTRREYVLPVASRRSPWRRGSRRSVPNRLPKVLGLSYDTSRRALRPQTVRNGSIVSDWAGSAADPPLSGSQVTEMACADKSRWI
jgi:hypothetical protein